MDEELEIAGGRRAGAGKEAFRVIGKRALMLLTATRKEELPNGLLLKSLFVVGDDDESKLLSVTGLAAIESAMETSTSAFAV